MSSRREVRRVFELARTQGSTAQEQFIDKLQSGNPEIELAALIALARFGDEAGCDVVMSWFLGQESLPASAPSAVEATYAYLVRFPARQDLRRLFVEWVRRADAPLAIWDREWLKEVAPSLLDESMSVEAATKASFNWPGAENMLDEAIGN